MSDSTPTDSTPTDSPSTGSTPTGEQPDEHQSAGARIRAWFAARDWRHVYRTRIRTTTVLLVLALLLGFMFWADRDNYYRDLDTPQAPTVQRTEEPEPTYDEPIESEEQTSESVETTPSLPGESSPDDGSEQQTGAPQSDPASPEQETPETTTPGGGLPDWVPQPRSQNTPQNTPQTTPAPPIG